MKRLIYAPKVYIFIRSANMGGRIYNLSEDVMSGSVERNINAESKANFVVRNRFRKYIVDDATGRQIFMPMDMVTIWLQRIAGKPIQVFTGYLDEVPMYQMLPGPCSFSATCTLKRLSFQWFDPGLEFFTSWINHMKGWRVDPTTGEAVNYSQAFNTSANDPNKINDGGFAQLISEFMTHIAGWNQNMVYVSDLPKDLPKIAANLYKSVNQEDESALSGLENVMRRVMGISWVPTNGFMPDGTIAPAEERITTAIKQSADKQNFPMVVAVIAAYLTTGYDAHYSQSYNTASGTTAAGDFQWGYGVYSMKPSLTESGGHPIPNPGGGHVTVGGTYTEGDTIEGYPVKEIVSNVTTATNALIKRCRQIDTQKVERGPASGQGLLERQARTGNSAAIRQMLEKALNTTFDPDAYANAVAQANKILKTFGQEHRTSVGQQASTTRSIIHLTWKSPEVTQFLTGDDQKVYGKHHDLYDALAPYFWMAKQVSPHLHISEYGSSKNIGQGTIIFTADQGHSQDLQSFFDSIKHHTEYQTIQMDGGTSEVWAAGQNQTPQGAGNNQEPAAVILTVSKAAKYPEWDGQKAVPVQNTVANSNDPTNQTPNVRFEDMAKMSLNAAFTSQFAFPINYIESHFLTGRKELMNDVSCMDAIGQFCQASMRAFMSLPGGQFLAFYPDYFGAHGRKPYWNIYDIEITNGGVQLNDQSLATHVFTIGDTFGMDGNIDQWDYVASRGVVTLDMPMMLRSFIQPLDTAADNIQADASTPLGLFKTAADFYSHYGARPYKEEVPIIRNSFFEFLYAWQRFMQKWAGCFNTSMSFTFQPEVMAGGIIGFPQHNLQMFVEQVTHQWDYSSGFTTTAQLSSPAAIDGGHKRSTQDIGSLPGMILGGNINTVGLPSS